MTLAGSGDIIAVDSVRQPLEQENAMWRDLVNRHADALADANAQLVDARRERDDFAERLDELVGQIADLCDEADSEAEQIGWSLGGLVSTGEIREALGIAAPATATPDGTPPA